MRQPIATAVVTAMFLAGCGSGGMTTGLTIATGLIDGELQRGTSTKMDVRRVLGPPKGSGSAAFPTDPRPREIWVYLEKDIRSMYCLVHLDQGRFQGYMWFSSLPLH